MTEDEMAGWHHGLGGRESEWTLGVGDRQSGLACCDSWGHKESDTTEQLNWTETLETLKSLNKVWLYYPPLPFTHVNKLRREWRKPFYFNLSALIFYSAKLHLTLRWEI